jgi:hypothetical protein
MSTETTKYRAAQAATDVPAFIGDLDASLFERKLSIAISQVAASVVDFDKPGKVQIDFAFERIEGTSQVRIEHVLKFIRPTVDGKAGEEEKRATVFHVGRGGALSLAQPSLLDDKQSRIPD